MIAVCAGRNGSFDMSEILIALKEAKNEQKETRKHLENEQKETRKFFELHLSKARTPRDVSGSKSTRADIFRQEAKVSDFKEVKDGKAIFDFEDVAQQALQDENDAGRDASSYKFVKLTNGKVEFQSEELFVMYLTPKLEELFRGRILVNSERVAWLRSRVPQSSRNNDQKPDWFVVDHEAFFTKIEKEYTEYECGKLSSWVLRDTADIIEAKLSGGGEGLAEAVEYCFDLAQHCLEDGCAHCELRISRAILVYPKGLCLITTSDKLTLTIEQCLWNTKGIYSHVQESFAPRDPWASSLTEACQFFGCEIGGETFAGSGGTARVFKVTQNGKPMALKLVSAKFVEQLDDEYSTMSKLCEDIQFEAIVAQPLGFKKLGSRFAAMLLPFGSNVHLSQTSCHVFKLKVFAAMHKLHQLGCTHGDPRLDNIITIEDNLLWIDFMGGKKMFSPPNEADELRRMNDLTILIKSITRAPTITPQHTQAIDHCGDTNYARLAGIVTVSTK